MDTHLADFSTTAPAAAPAAAPTVEASAPAAAAASRKPRRRRRALLNSACVVVVAAVAGGVFLISPYNHVYPVDVGRLDASVRKLAAEAGVTLPQFMAPAARLASAPAPQRHDPPVRTAEQRHSRAETLRQVLGFRAGTAGEASPGQGAAPASAPVGAGAQASAAAPAAMASVVEPNVLLPVPVRPGAAALPPAPAVLPAPMVPPAPAVLSTQTSASSANAAVAESAPPSSEPAAASEHAQAAPVQVVAAPAPVQVALAAPAAPAVPAAPPISPPLADSPPPPVAVAVIAPPASALPAAPPPTLAPAPLDPALVAVGLDPAPMTDEQQVQVLGLVTELGVLIRNQRTEIAQLRADQQSLREHVDVAVADFGRRLALAEAGGAMSAAMGAGAPAAAPGGSASARDAVARGGRLAPLPVADRVVARPAALAATPAAGAHRYRVQAASPSLAMLSELDPSGDDRAQLQVSLGSEVPGYGRVTGITQHGTSWQVRTDRGTIE